MAENWEKAQQECTALGHELMYHDFDTDTFGTCKKGGEPGHFVQGRFVEHRCICMPATMDPQVAAEKEKAFLTENKDWASQSEKTGQ
ncbi:hypothetical protein [Methanosphaerula palustris]|uniref:Uncharacterized protein n=1 Tax=Methanosphaerula palustris (strain ATCC BAA-1556 / DSM 19958 / E1-9c) TaxID=521011 RepID=B8GII4_METPE|nr:hypothetical protein [Methanosphaerula palustris]ACL15535.1 conserved hypothetical protein [Methanosphaerula palustris E1-9c]